MPKTIVSVSKKGNSGWRMDYYDIDDYDNWTFFSEKINPLLVWFYKLQKQKLCNDICMICGNEFKFYKKRFEDGLDICYECEPVQVTT